MNTVIHSHLESVAMHELGKAIQALEFDSVVTLTRNPFEFGATLTDVRDVYAPAVYHDPDGDVTIEGEGWEAVTGLTGQYGYSGAVMHPSEYVGAGVARELVRLAEDGPLTFALVTVECLDDDEPAGWAIVTRTA